MKTAIGFIILLLSLSTGNAQDKPLPSEHFAPDRTYHVIHYRLKIAIDEKAKTCVGEVSIRLVPLRAQLDTIRLAAAQMSISETRLGNTRLDHYLTGETLVVALGKQYTFRDTIALSVAYSLSAPQKGLYFIEPDSGYPKQQRLVWSNGEAEENHFWFPCYDYPNDMSTSEMIVTVNEQWMAISNGKLLDVKHDGKHHQKTYHWLESKPHVSYLISLVAGDYVEVKDSWGTLPLSYFVYRHQQPDAMRSFAKTPKIMEFYSSRIRYPYAWEKYSQTVVQDYIWGGEENVSATTLTDNTIHDARAHLDYNSDGLVAHELAHQWWGDMLTCKDWSHTWLNEGFASYFDILFQEFDKGKDVAWKSVYDAQRDLVNTDIGDRRRPTVNRWFVNPNEVFSNRIYGKGACVLHMMRFVLGDELFWKGIDHYVHKHAFQNVETNDLKVAIEEATGYNLHWFFDEWLYKAGYPEFEVKTSWDRFARAVNVDVRQTQHVDSLTGIFATPVDVEVWDGDEPATYRVDISKAEEHFTLPANQEPKLVLFDKGSRILKKLKQDKPIDEWVFQLEHASDGVDRIIAADELRWFVDSGVATQALRKAALSDGFFEVRREAVWALGDAKKTDVSEALVAAYGDRDARVRASSLIAMRKSKGANVLKTLQHAFETDSSYSVASAALQSLVKVDSMNAVSYCKAALLRDSYREGIRNAALRLLGDIGSDEAFQIVKAYTAYGHPRNVRQEAIGLLSRVWKTHEGVLPYLVGMLEDPSVAVRRNVVGVLGEMQNTEAIIPLQKVADSNVEPKLSKAAHDAVVKIQQSQQQQNGH